MKHCTRLEILRWARSGAVTDPAARAHLEGCADCRRLWEVARAFAGAGETTLSAAPSGWVERAVAIGRRPRRLSRLTEVVGRLVLDSWAAPAPVGLRGEGGAESRRLRWEAGEWTVDLRAEAAASGWELVAQVQEAGKAVPGAALDFNSERVHTDAAGMAVWSGRRPPRNLTLYTTDGSVRFGDIQWSRPKHS